MDSRANMRHNECSFVISYAVQHETACVTSRYFFATLPSGTITSPRQGEERRSFQERRRTKRVGEGPVQPPGRGRFAFKPCGSTRGASVRGVVTWIYALGWYEGALDAFGSTRN